MAETHLASDPALVATNQPDVLKLHIEYLRPGELTDSTITVTNLRVGAVSSTLQLSFSQKGKLKALALATSTNFARPIGPSARTDWTPLPAPKPKPDFAAVLASRPDLNWLPGRLTGELVGLTKRMLFLYPRGGATVDGICDQWHYWHGHGRNQCERVDATQLVLEADIIPSLSDTLLRNGEFYDAHAIYGRLEQWAEQNLGSTCERTTSAADVREADSFNNTVSLDIEFKRRVPSGEQGLRWVFTRAAAKMLRDERMDLDIIICDEDMELVALAHQLILVLEMGRKFRTERVKSAL